MYTIAVKRDFITRHYLVGGNWGAENLPHAHHYQIELQLQGDTLDRHGYLVDIVEIEAVLDSLVAQYRDQMLNDLPEFQGLNPSIEHFSCILCHQILGHIKASNIRAITVTVWENQIAWAAYHQTIVS